MNWSAIAASVSAISLGGVALGIYMRLLFRAELAELELRLNEKYIRREECEHCQMMMGRPATAGQ